MEINKKQLDILNSLNDKEKDVVKNILNQISLTNNSQIYNDLIYADYKEIPVDIETFITDDRYLGKAWKDAAGNLKMYPFWMNELKKIFPTNIDTNYETILETGARGLGKSEIACGAICTYLMYRVLCLKNPLEYYHLKSTEKICFAFMNITLALSEKIAINIFQKTIQMSPWFMSRGKMTSYNNMPYWLPPAPLDIIIGSQSDDVIGQAIFFCLDGDTVIKTTEGDFKIRDLENKSIRVPTINNDNEIVVSDECTVKMTGIYNEEYQIELEDGTILKCTPNHKFMLKDGTYKEAKDLTEDDELMDTKPFGYI